MHHSPFFWVAAVAIMVAMTIYVMTNNLSVAPGGKMQQVLRSIQLELCYSKDAILEAYLNYAPYGRNVEGAGAASLVYFDKPVNQLSLPEARK